MPRTFVARLLLVASFLLLCAAPAVGEESAAAVQDVAIALHEDGWHLDADVSFELNPQLRNAVERGLPLYFSADVTITRPRWWWFDQQVVSQERLWSISYNALIREWRVRGGGLALPVSSLDEALALVRHIRNWVIAPADALEPGEEYLGRVRLRLDVSQLSRPFQVNAMNSSAWALSTPWKEFSIQVPERAGRQP